MKYNCYVDESNHDRSIKYLEEKGKFNFELQNSNNEFIVVNTLIKDDNVSNVYKMMLKFRERYKYDENTELKGQNFFQGTKKIRSLLMVFTIIQRII